MNPPPGSGARPDDADSTVVVADGFSWLALLFPWPWLIWHRLWFMALGALALQLSAGYLSTLDGFFTAAMLAGLSVNLLTALEGQNWVSERWIRRGWQLTCVIPASDRDTAEEIYFSAFRVEDRKAPKAVAEWKRRLHNPASNLVWQGPLSLSENGGR